MLKSRLLRSDEHARFVAFNKTNSGAPIPAGYLDRATIRIFYRANDPDRWVAAYVVNTTVDFRYLSVLELEKKTDLLAQHRLRESDLVEITLLCRDRSLDWPAIDREWYYLNSIIDALRTGRRVVLGGTTREDLRQAQMQILDSLLHEGELNMFGQTKSGWLFYATRTRVLGNVARRAMAGATQRFWIVVSKLAGRRVGSLPNS
ncbi:hypothetical protein [Spirosoma montaniterrae]|uniref:Uncharacterized protein n=1 Tax=Spirosoma montaniterrae TaxID=1178516 RepID=A0A1P9WT52_9BACT|nr:hypothetical protein [Spirosoma montaniterrae]AQG78549.1 hypothetical protein AWR27_03850 [Spirosoma montaniterrae]